MVTKGTLEALFSFIPWLLNFSDLPNYGSNLRERYTLRLFSKCLLRSTLFPIRGKVPPTLRYPQVITKWCKIYTTLTADFKNHMRNLDNFRQAVESPKSWNSMGYICLKTTFLHLKHSLQIYLTLLSTDLWFRKWYEEYEKFPPEHLKVSKLGFWWNPLTQSWKSMSLKPIEELSVMVIKNDTKFEEELTCHFKFYKRNLTNFDLSTWKSSKSSF